MFTFLLCGTQAGSTPILETPPLSTAQTQGAALWFRLLLELYPSGQPRERKKEGRRDTGEPGIFHRKFLEVATAHFCFHFIGQNTIIWPYLRSKARNCGFFLPGNNETHQNQSFCYEGRESPAGSATCCQFGKDNLIFLPDILQRGKRSENILLIYSCVHMRLSAFLPSQSL